MQRTLMLAALVSIPIAAHSQTPVSPAADDVFVSSTRAIHERVKDYIIRSAEQMPEENYSFRPTPEVRSFGQLIGHLANGQYLFCSLALGAQNPAGENFEQTKTSKAELVEAISAAFQYCDSAYQMTDMQAAEVVTVFGSQQPRLYALVFNVSHNMEHYGNIVTYMRMKGLVPPSSQGDN